MRALIRRHAWGLALALGVLALAVLGWPHEAHASPLLRFGAAGTVGGLATDTFELDNAMKVLFEDSLEVDVVSESELLDLFETDMNVQEERTGGGRYIETAQLFGLPAGYGYRNESDPIPVPRGPQIENGRIYLKKSMGSVSITGDVFAKVKAGREAFTTWAEQQMPLLTQRMANTKDRIMVGYGVGVLARVATVTAGTKTITVNSAFGVTGFTQAILAFLQNEDIACGPNIDGTGLRANAAAGTNYHAVTVDLKGGKIVLDDVTNIAVGDYIFSTDQSGVIGGADSNGTNREFMGLLGHVDDGGILLDYFNIARDAHPAWGSVVIDGSVAPYNGVFNDELIVYGDMQGQLYGGAKIDVLAVPYAGCFNFWKDLKSDRMLTDPRAYTGGNGRLKVRIQDRLVELQGIRKLPPQVAFGLTKGTFRRYTLGKFQWSNRTGSIWQQVIASGNRYDAFWAYGTDYDEIFCKDPQKNIRWDGLSA